MSAVVITDKSTGRKLDITEAYTVGFDGSLKRIKRIKGRCQDKDRPWYGQLEVIYDDEEECYVDEQEIFIRLDDVFDTFFNRKKKS